MPGPTGQNETRLNRVQAAIEAARGTAIAATRKTYAAGSGTFERPLAFVNMPNGTYDARTIPVKGRGAGSFSITDVATFEDLPFWLEGMLKGSVTPTADTGTPPAETWDFVPSAATDDLASYTLEWGDPGNAYQIPQFLIDSWTIRGDPDNANEPAWMVEAQGPTLAWVPHAFTGSLTDRTTEIIKAAGTKIYLDDAGGTIGTTPLNGQLISWSVTGNINRHLKAFAEDEFGPAPGRSGRGDRTVDMQLVLEFFDDVEYAHYRDTALVQRLIRLERSGTQIHDTPTTPKLLQIDGAGYWGSYSLGDRDGNKTITLTLMTALDAVLGYAFKASVVNALATL